MPLSRLLPAALLVAVSLSPACAADLRKIDRTVPDEPKFSTAAPNYCLLAFGPEARTTVWLIRDGDVMQVHASPDGKAAKTWRQVRSESAFDLGNIWEDERTCHKNLRCWPRSGHDMVAVYVGGKRQIAGRDRSGKLKFAATAKEAPVIHFNGPLTLDLFYDQEPFEVGGGADMTAVVGTPGVGPGTFATFMCDAYPPKVWPKAVIEFPTRYGGKPIVTEVRLADE
jgi:hypothetical protein